MNGKFRVINSRQALNDHISEITQQWETHKWLMTQVTTEKQRSRLQNNSLHLWCDMVAGALNGQGLDVRQVMEHSKRAEIPWTGAAVKEHLWRPVQQQYNGKESTTKASTSDYPAIYEILNKAMGQAFGIHVPWPIKQRMAAND